jgi:hypothetical protein
MILLFHIHCPALRPTVVLSGRRGGKDVDGNDPNAAWTTEEDVLSRRHIPAPERFSFLRLLLLSHFGVRSFLPVCRVIDRSTI